MSVTEQNALIRAKDTSGNSFIIYPVTKAENVDGLDDSLNGKANSEHSHDDRYYTESEIDSKLSDKSDAEHVHSWNDLNDRPFYDIPLVYYYNGLIDTSQDEVTITLDNSILCDPAVLSDGDIARVTLRGEPTELSDMIWRTDTLKLEDLSRYGSCELDPTGTHFENIFTGISFDVMTYKTATIYFVSDVSIPQWVTHLEIYKEDQSLAKALDVKYLPVDDKLIYNSNNPVRNSVVTEAINAVSNKVTTLIGEDTSKSVRTIANEELTKQLIADDAKESLDTLSEIAAWIQSHPDDASAMNQAISDLKALVGTLPDGVTATTVVDYINEAAAGADADTVNPDWNQSDPTAKDYVKNRIAYKDNTGVVTIGSGTFSTDESSPVSQLTLIYESFTGFVEGDSYQVTVDGVTSDYVGRYVEAYGAVLVLSFDPDNASEVTDGWFIGYANNALVAVAQGSYLGKTVSIVGCTYDIKKLPIELLPDGAVTESSLETYREEIMASVNSEDTATLNSAKAYTDEQLAAQSPASQVQFITWEADD